MVSITDPSNFGTIPLEELGLKIVARLIKIEPEFSETKNDIELDISIRAIELEKC